MSSNVSAYHVAAQKLADSETGRDTLRRVLEWLDTSGLSLDGRNKLAIMLLIDGAMGWGLAGSVREAMRAALSSSPAPDRRD